MITDQTRLLLAGVLAAIVMVSGVLLTRGGRPYGALLFNGHKLIALGVTVLLVVTIVQANRAAPITAPLLTATFGVGVLSVVTIVSGGLSNIESMPMAVVWLHRVTTFFTLAAAAVTVYLLARGG